MESLEYIPELLKWAVLVPFISFWVIFLVGPLLGKNGESGGYVATGAILTSFVLSMISFAIWVSNYMPEARSAHHDEHGHGEEHHDGDHGHEEEDHEHEDEETEHSSTRPDDSVFLLTSAREEETVSTEALALLADPGGASTGDRSSGDEEDDHGAAVAPVVGDWYVLGEFGKLKLTIGYYIDGLTVCMFCMVTLIASCIHFYAMGYMHEELHDVEDHEVTLEDGSHLKRPGRYPRFFQFLSLFCFSMLGLVVAGNVAMTFVFWELVGICSYFLIGFYVERKSASTAANKAFIVNRVGDFGMIIGLMALWASLGTFVYGDAPVLDEEGQVVVDEHGHKVIEHGLFSLVRPHGTDHKLQVPDGMVVLSAQEKVAEVVRQQPEGASREEIEAAIALHIPQWREGTEDDPTRYGYWLLVVAGVGIFCGCVGKSAQFPLQTWLPDAMEGPTPVSALVHSATMVAAGVFLVARFYPVFAPEVLLVIALVGTITLFMAATIAITATDIKRVLAYSTVSQLGYMMLALGVGGWLAGVLHLFTHAFFKSLLFMCSGSVIHAVHSNEMTEMGGLRKKMPWTAYTMLIGCLAIAGAGIPFVIGMSGYYSKDAILEHALLFGQKNAGLGQIFFFAAAAGASITAFYMFRLWFMTFAGPPRNQDRYDHAHESPPVMYVPLVVLAVFATGVAWEPFTPNLPAMLEQARPTGTLAESSSALIDMTMPNEHDGHVKAIKVPATLTAFFTALVGFLLAVVFYGTRKLNPEDVRRQFAAIYKFLINKWYFDELYDAIFVRPTLFISGKVANFDRRWIDWVIDGTASCVRRFSQIWEFVFDQIAVDGFVNTFARWLYWLAVSLRGMQTGRVRQYVMFIVVGTVALFVLVSFFWGYAGAN